MLFNSREKRNNAVCKTVCFKHICKHDLNLAVIKNC